jgi:hypothetical protein
MVNTDRSVINRAYPFLSNFPFDKDFDMQISTSPVVAVMFDDDFETSKSSTPYVINFKHVGSPIKASISIVKDELIWLGETAESIKKLDKIAKRIDRGIKAKDLLIKRDMSLEADEWMRLVADHKSSLSQETFNEVLSSLVGNRSVNQTVALINNLNKLYSKTGLVKLSRAECDVIFTFLHFRLIYAKLILGIVIASKISI